MQWKKHVKIDYLTDYFMHVKMQRDCALLSLRPKSINEIAYQIGYEDPYYYSRIFKKIIGGSPQHYRATIGIDNTESGNRYIGGFES